MLRRALFASLITSLLAACGKSEAPNIAKKTDGKIDSKLKELGIILPEATTPIAAYTPFRVVDNMVYIAGQGPNNQGKVGRDYSTDQAYNFARDAGISVISQLKSACGGDLDRVIQCVQIQGIVNCTSDYNEQHLVINGCSELFRDIFGQSGLAARAAIGTNSLPVGFVCEVIASFEIKEA